MEETGLDGTGQTDVLPPPMGCYHHDPPPWQLKWLHRSDETWRGLADIFNFDGCGPCYPEFVASQPRWESGRIVPSSLREGDHYVHRGQIWRVTENFMRTTREGTLIFIFAALRVRLEDGNVACTPNLLRDTRRL